jgi:hypothetical protein
MAQKSVISFVKTLVLFLVLRKSKLTFSRPFICLCNCIAFAWDVSATGGGLPDWLDGACCCPSSMKTSASSPWSASTSNYFSGAKNFRVGTSCFDSNWGSLTPVVNVVGSFALLSESSVGFYFRLLCSRNSSLDGGAVIVVLAIYTLPAPSFKTAFKSCSTSVYTPNEELYSCFRVSNWWRSLLVSSIFWTIKVHFEISPTDAGVHFAIRAMKMRIQRANSMTAVTSEYQVWEELLTL